MSDLTSDVLLSSVNVLTSDVVNNKYGVLFVLVSMLHGINVWYHVQYRLSFSYIRQYLRVELISVWT